MRSDKVCGECKWLTEECRHGGKCECMHPKKRERWARLEQTKRELGESLITVTARYKYRSDTACKKFEKRMPSTDCLWK